MHAFVGGRKGLKGVMFVQITVKPSCEAPRSSFKQPA
jgi:hypothetical protein